MELKEGMYVRFKDKRGNHYIRKIKEVCNEYPHKAWGGIFIDVNANYVDTVSLKNIIKASYNIIDLIEVGDYVNGLRVHGITDYGLEVYMFGDAHEILEENEIETIVTKEQFSQMEYKVGE